MSECIHGDKLHDCCSVAELPAEPRPETAQHHVFKCYKHNVVHDGSGCGLCIDFPDETPQNSQLNELISNILKTQAVTVQMVADIIDKVNNLQFAIKELKESKKKAYTFHISTDQGRQLVHADDEEDLKKIVEGVDYIILSKDKVYK